MASQSSTNRPAPSPKPCKVCNTLTTKLCEKCCYTPMDSFNHTLSTFYCRVECQEQDWESHRQVCVSRHERRTLFRVAHLLLKLFYEIRSRASDRYCTEYIDRPDGGIRVGVGLWPEDWPSLRAFPQEKLTTKQQRHVAMSFDAEKEAMSFLWIFAAVAFKRMKVEAIEFKSMPRPHVVPTCQHLAWKVSLLNGEKWAVDLQPALLQLVGGGSASCPVISWSRYKAMFAKTSRAHSSICFGYFRDNGHFIQDELGDSPPASVIFILFEIKELMATIDRWFIRFMENDPDEYMAIFEGLRGKHITARRNFLLKFSNHLETTLTKMHEKEEIERRKENSRDFLRNYVFREDATFEFIHMFSYGGALELERYFLHRVTENMGNEMFGECLKTKTEAFHRLFLQVPKICGEDEEYFTFPEVPKHWR